MGTIDTFTTLLTYWWEIYDPSRSRNMLTPVVQSQQQSMPAGVSTSTIGTSITTWRSDWGSGDGCWAPDRNFAALTASPPTFNSWQPTDAPPASGYRMTGRVLQRTGAGLLLQTQSSDPFNTPSLVTYDTSGSYPVATAGNVAPGTDMLSWFGCEPYESSGLWASSDPALSIWSYLTQADSHTGTQCLALPANTAANGPLLVVQPERPDAALSLFLANSATRSRARLFPVAVLVAAAKQTEKSMECTRPQAAAFSRRARLDGGSRRH